MQALRVSDYLSLSQGLTFRVLAAWLVTCQQQRAAGRQARWRQRAQVLFDTISQYMMLVALLLYNAERHTFSLQYTTFII